jgi:hypothetical protein
MNERIALLALKASDPKTGWLDRQKFAQLIVRECLTKIENEAAQYAEPVWAFELVNDIKEHFGVEE